jgi:glycosyltransferase involved in cell wall biosynthesis
LHRVAFLIPTIDRLGGAERQLILLAKGLEKRGWGVDVVALSGSGGPAARDLASSGVSFTSLKMRKGLADPRGWWRLNRWLVRHRPEIVHTHLPHATWMARWSRTFGPRYALVDTIHTSATGTWSRRLGYRISDGLADSVTAVSEGAAAAYIAAGMVSDHRIVVLPNGIDTTRWCPDHATRDFKRHALGLTNEFLWFASGRLERVKDYSTLLRAFQRLRGSSRLVIAGSGSLRDTLRLLAVELRIEGRVNFLDFVDDVQPWLRAADGFALSSLWEGLSMGLLESAACTVPAVATDVPGNQEIILPGQTGLLVPPRNVDVFTVAMNHMMDMSIADREAMGMRAREVVCERFGIEYVLDRWESLYEQVLCLTTESVAVRAPLGR